jgi:hypothetical protein
VRRCCTNDASEERNDPAQESYKERSQEFERSGFAYFGFTRRELSPSAKIGENGNLQVFQQEKEQAC